MKTHILPNLCSVSAVLCVCACCGDMRAIFRPRLLQCFAMSHPPRPPTRAVLGRGGTEAGKARGRSTIFSSSQAAHTDSSRLFFFFSCRTEEDEVNLLYYRVTSPNVCCVIALGFEPKHTVLVLKEADEIASRSFSCLEISVNGPKIVVAGRRTKPSARCPERRRSRRRRPFPGICSISFSLSFLRPDLCVTSPVPFLRSRRLDGESAARVFRCHLF